MTTNTSTTAELEKVVLSAMIQAADDADFNALATTIRARDMRLPGHAQLYAAIVDAHDRSTGKDRSPAMIWAQVVRRGDDQTLTKMKIDLGYIEEVAAQAVGMATGMETAQVLHEKATKQRIAAALAAARDGVDGESSVNATISRIDRLLLDAVGEDRSGIVHAGDLSDTITQAVLGKKPLSLYKVLTGNPVFDDVAGGIESGSLNYIIGPSHHGKSTLARDIAARVAYHQRNQAAVVFIPLEETKEKATFELMSYWTGPDSPWVINRPEPRRRTPLSSDDIKDFARAGNPSQFGRDRILQIVNADHILKASSLEIADAASTIDDIRPLIAQTMRRYPDALIVGVLDYMQNLSGTHASQSEVDILQNAAKFLRNAITAPWGMQGRGAWIAVSQIRGAAVENLKDRVDPDTPAREIVQMEHMKGSSSLYQSGDFIVGTLMYDAIVGSSQAKRRANDYQTVQTSVLKNKISARGAPDVVLRRHALTGQVVPA